MSNRLLIGFIFKLSKLAAGVTWKQWRPAWDDAENNGHQGDTCWAGKKTHVKFKVRKLKMNAQNMRRPMKCDSLRALIESPARNLILTFNKL